MLSDSGGCACERATSREAELTCLREGVVDLADGRRLGFGEYGRRGGAPVLFFHGMPGGRAFDLGRAVAEHGVWLFVLERPGIGLSDPHPEASVWQWPADVAGFADAMGFGRFAAPGCLPERRTRLHADTLWANG